MVCGSYRFFGMPALALLDQIIGFYNIYCLCKSLKCALSGDISFQAFDWAEMSPGDKIQNPL